MLYILIAVIWFDQSFLVCLLSTCCGRLGPVGMALPEMWLIRPQCSEGAVKMSTGLPPTVAPCVILATRTVYATV